MAIKQDDAINLQQAIQNHFSRSGESYITATLRPATPIHDDRFVVVTMNLDGYRLSITFEEMVSLDVVKATVRLARAAWSAGKTQGREDAMDLIGAHLKRVVNGNYEAKNEESSNG